MYSKDPVVQNAVDYQAKKLAQGAWDQSIATPPAEFKAQFPNLFTYMVKKPEYRRRWAKELQAMGINADVAMNAKVGDTVVYAGGPHTVVKDLGGGKFVLRSRTTGRTVSVSTTKGLEVLEPGSFANARMVCSTNSHVANAVTAANAYVEYDRAYADEKYKESIVKMMVANNLKSNIIALLSKLTMLANDAKTLAKQAKREEEYSDSPRKEITSATNRNEQAMDKLSKVANDAGTRMSRV